MTKQERKRRDINYPHDRLISVDYILIMFSSSVFSFMNHFFNAATPLYVQRLQGTTLQTGFVIMAYNLTALVVRPVAGIISDKTGRVKQLIMGAVICAASCFFFGLAGVIPLLAIIRSVNGIGFGMHSTSAGAAIADVLPKSRMAEGIGYFGLYSTLAQALAPGIALEIVKGDEISDYRTLFMLTACLGSAAIITNCFISYERKRKKAAVNSETQFSENEKTQPHEMSSVEGPLPKTLFGFEYAVFAPVGVMVLMFAGTTCLMNYLSLFARWRGFGNPAMYFIFSGIGILISRLVFGKVVDKRGSDIVIIPGMAIMLISMALIPLTGSLAALIALGLPLGLAQGAVVPTFNSMLFKRCSAARRGTASGAYFSTIDIGIGLGAPFLGAIADASDYRFIYWVAAALVTLSLILYVLFITDRRYNARHASSGL